MTDPWSAVIVALISSVGAIFAARAATQAKQSRINAEQANEAVNNVKELGKPRLYDMVQELRVNMGEIVQWKRGYDGGPLDTGGKVVEFVHRVDEKLDDVQGRVKSIEDMHSRLGCVHRDEHREDEQDG